MFISIFICALFGAIIGFFTKYKSSRFFGLLKGLGIGSFTGLILFFLISSVMIYLK
jgi:hypothetical protein